MIRAFLQFYCYNIDMRHFSVILAFITFFPALEAENIDIDKSINTVNTKLEKLTFKGEFFDAYNQKGVEKLGLRLALAEISRSLKKNMAYFTGSLQKKPSIYIYKDKKSYLKSGYDVWSWSRATAYPVKAKILTYVDGPIREFKSVVAHELSHIFLQSFFGRRKDGKLRYPPLWLDEGMAVKVEDEVYYPKNRMWYKELKQTNLKKRVNFKKHFSSDVGTFKNSKKVQRWYIISYGIVKFLSDTHGNLRFKNFCDELKSGTGIEKALFTVYKYKSIGDLQTRWHKWVNAGAKNKGFSVLSDTKTFFEYESPLDKQIERQKKKKSKFTFSQSDF